MRCRGIALTGWFCHTVGSELWHCLEGLSIEPFAPDAAANWIKHYPGGLTFAE
ncbi:hypothetical protein [Dickeya dadantii]|uniref:hypothetical protein n=1 Tax=Dickeya dadantii TaxID=204038 RepID=UPI000302E680|nr:hypothetical protein [Dickeya dadantii]